MELFPFIVKNWHLFAALVIVIALLLADPLRRLALKVGNVTPAELVILINRSQGVVLDVREPSEYQAGHITGAINIPSGELAQRLGELRKHKSRPVTIVGRNALRAAGLLRRDGFEAVNLLAGGIAAWERNQLPLEK